VCNDNLDHDEGNHAILTKARPLSIAAVDAERGDERRCEALRFIPAPTDDGQHFNKKDRLAIIIQQMAESMIIMRQQT